MKQEIISRVRIDKSFPLLFTLCALVFAYVLQYPLSLLLTSESQVISYELNDWFRAYLFVISSCAVFLLALYVGVSGRRVAVNVLTITNMASKELPLLTVLFIFLIFAGWSYLMIELKIGMTIFTDFDPLPFRITGFLFYGRKFIQPLVLMYIAYHFRQSNKRWLILLLMLLLGAWASLTSGSRGIAVFFSLPILLLFSGKSRWIFCLGSLSAFLIVATLARHFYLPFVIGGEYILIYANEVYQSNIIKDLWMIPLSYAIERPMGIREVFMVLNYGEICPTFGDAVQRLLSVFLFFVEPGAGASHKNIYGLDDDAFGGFGLGFLPNYWVIFGGTIPTYAVGLFFTGWLLGKSHRLFSILLCKIGGITYIPFVFVIFLILIYEAQATLFPYVLIAAWVAGRPYSLRIYRTFLRLCLRGRKRGPLSVNVGNPGVRPHQP